MAVCRRGESCPRTERTGHQATCAWQRPHESLQKMCIASAFSRRDSIANFKQRTKPHFCSLKAKTENTWIRRIGWLVAKNPDGPRRLFATVGDSLQIRAESKVPCTRVRYVSDLGYVSKTQTRYTPSYDSQCNTLSTPSGISRKKLKKLRKSCGKVAEKLRDLLSEFC